MKDKRISDYIDSKKEEMLADIARLVAVKSTKGKSTPDCPFGKETAEALNLYLSMCKEYGFVTKNISNAIGIADIKEDNGVELGILCHLDVVPAGDGWNTDPFRLEIKDGNIIGRGTSDDKGPAVAALYAMRAVKELGIKLTKNPRLIVGTDEECGSSDLKYYFANEPTPHYSVSPDAEYPVINTEKGRFAPHFEMTVPDESNASKRITFFDGGAAVNQVPNVARMTVCGIDVLTVEAEAKKIEQKTGVYFEIASKDSNVFITSNGRAAHASTPELGLNPITALLELCEKLPLDKINSTEALRSLAKMFPWGDFTGKALSVERKDDVSGKLSMTLDVVKFDGKTLSADFDSRMPVSSTKENTVEPVLEKLKAKGFEVKEMRLTPVHHVCEDSELIKTLLSKYEDYTERKGECIAIGGGTYVHEIENGVAFGCIMPEVDTNMHGPNEFMPIEDLLTSAKIYASVIADICK